MAGSGGGVVGIVVDGTVCGAGCGAGCGNFGTDFCGTTGGIPLGTCPKGGRPAGGIPAGGIPAGGIPNGGSLAGIGFTLGGGVNWSAIDFANAAAISS